MKNRFLVLSSALIIPLAAMMPVRGPADLGGETAKILAGDGTAGDLFGYSVAVSGTGGIAGAPVDDAKGFYSGSAYLFAVNAPGVMTKLTPSDIDIVDEFGFSVGISGGVAIVGALNDDDNGTDSGSAYLFDSFSGQQIAKLLASDGAPMDRFGAAVAISGNTAIVGAYDNDAVNICSGAAYLFDTATGQQKAKLVASDGGLDDSFGWSVAIDGTTAIVGAIHDDDNGDDSGACFLFDTTTGLQTKKLLALDGEAGDQFGTSVAIDGSIAVVGAIRDNVNGAAAGSAYLFSTLTGQQIIKLLPSDGSASALFGMSCAISGGVVAIGASGDNSFSGSIYLFDAATGRELKKILPSDPTSNKAFGISAALDGANMVVGAHIDDEQALNAGAVYTFDIASEPASVSEYNGSGQNARRLANVTYPVLGTDWECDLDASGHASGLAAIVVYTLPSAGFFLPAGELLLDLTSGFLTQVSLPHVGSVVRFGFPIPNDLSFCGQSATAQGVVFGAPGVELSNALNLTAGS